MSYNKEKKIILNFLIYCSHHAISLPLKVLKNSKRSLSFTFSCLVFNSHIINQLITLFLHSSIRSFMKLFKAPTLCTILGTSSLSLRDFESRGKTARWQVNTANREVCGAKKEVCDVWWLGHCRGDGTQCCWGQGLQSMKERGHRKPFLKEAQFRRVLDESRGWVGVIAGRGDPLCVADRWRRDLQVKGSQVI